MKHLKLFESYNEYTQNMQFVKLNMSTEDAFDYIDYKDSYEDLYPGYSNTDADDEDADCYYSTKESAYESVNYILDLLETLPDLIPVYRTIHVQTIADVDLESLGECWSFVESSAREFGVHISANVLMSGLIKSENVDWEQTVQLHFLFSGGNAGDDENEIRANYPVVIENLKVDWIGKKPSA